MNNDKPLTPINDERSERYYPNTLVSTVVQGVTIPPAKEHQPSLEEIELWDLYKANCLYMEWPFEFFDRMVTTHGSDWKFRIFTLEHKP